MNAAHRITKCAVIALALSVLVLLWNPLKSLSQSSSQSPGAHHKFTDHQIRIVKPGEAYPN